MLRYEDLVADAEREVRKIVQFLNLNTTSAQITQAVERSSAARMRELEKAQGEDVDRLVGRKSRKDLMFVRAAVSDGWRKDLPMAMVEKIEAVWGPLMQHLGYESATQRPHQALQGAAWNRSRLGVGANARTAAGACRTQSNINVGCKPIFLQPDTVVLCAWQRPYWVGGTERI